MNPKDNWRNIRKIMNINSSMLNKIKGDYGELFISKALHNSKI